MKLGWFRRGVVLIGTGWIIACLTLLTSNAQLQSNKIAPLRASDFVQAAPRGFGDQNNSWAQAMVWWHGNLYVGTARQTQCTAWFGINQFVATIFGVTFAQTWFPYPPKDPDLVCAADGADLLLQAEIWRWTPSGESWQRVFQSPLDLDNPGPGPPAPPRTGKKLPYEISFRGFAPYTDPDGTEALYAFGVNSTVLWDRNQLPPPRILRTTDGLNWTPVPQAPGTFLGDLPFNPDHSSFRSPVSFNGKLFVLCGPIFGQGALIASANPAQGNNAWFLASSPALQFYELAVFNGWLYIGGFDPVGGYTVFKTRAQGTPPYPLTLVVPPGANLNVRPSRSVVSMHEYSGRLYVGTGTQTEIVRINPDDTWDLVIGPPRTSGGELKYPISGLDAGFGHTLNDHAWQMEDPYHFLYVGTYNASTGQRFDPVFGPLLRHNMGAHLYRTPDGWYFSPVTTNGFARPSDARGGIFDFGIRTMASTSFGAFLGTANDHFGFMIFRAVKPSLTVVDPPERLEVEPGRSNRALLSWRAVPRATGYRIWRADINPILVRDDINFFNWNFKTGNKIPDIYTGPPYLIGTTLNLTFIDPMLIDPTVLGNRRYVYYVDAVIQQGQVFSEPSNLVNFPLLAPPMTFALLLGEVDRLNQRGRFKSPEVFQVVRGQIVDARAAAAACRIQDAMKLDAKSASNAVMFPESTDLEILISKLLRRLQLFSQYPQEVQSNEFCIP